METEPKLWGARRFSDAQRVADAGKMLEAAQRYGHDLTVERRTQRKIAHKLCEQARLMDAVVEKMKQHRRQQVVAKQADRDRLQSRVRSRWRAPRVSGTRSTRPRFGRRTRPART